MPKIGDTIYQFDENHRVYRRENGRAIGGPIYSGYFVPHVISGETKQSWLTGYENRTKVNKKTMQSASRGGFLGHCWFTEDGMAGRLWLAEHRRNIIGALEKADIEQMKRVAEIVGYRADAR